MMTTVLYLSQFVCCSALLIPPTLLAAPVARDADVACVLSHAEIKSLQPLRVHEGAVPATALKGLTIDCGLHQLCEASVDALGIELVTERGATKIRWPWIARVVKRGRAGAWECWMKDEDEDEDEEAQPSKVEGFSELTQRPASLLPLDDEGGQPPTVVLGGFNMHSFKGMSSKGDTERKLGALGSRLRGTVLDVCTGLGYTACGAAAEPATEHVVTIELDPLMIEMQRANPWSAALFADSSEAHSAKITRLLGDATEVLPALPAGAFDCCIHDPPTNAMSGELYSEDFYAQIRRCLRPNGALFHYVGDPSSKASGRLFKGITERLRRAGFESVKTVQEAYGIVAIASGNGRHSALTSDDSLR
jgi:predicted methyltransferase